MQDYVDTRTEDKKVDMSFRDIFGIDRKADLAYNASKIAAAERGQDLMIDLFTQQITKLEAQLNTQS
jgi:hypothetical protein